MKSIFKEMLNYICFTLLFFNNMISYKDTSFAGDKCRDFVHSGKFKSVIWELFLISCDFLF